MNHCETNNKCSLKPEEHFLVKDDCAAFYPNTVKLINSFHCTSCPEAVYCSAACAKNLTSFLFIYLFILLSDLYLYTKALHPKRIYMHGSQRCDCKQPHNLETTGARTAPTDHYSTSLSTKNAKQAEIII